MKYFKPSFLAPSLSSTNNGGTRMATLSHSTLFFQPKGLEKVGRGRGEMENLPPPVAHATGGY